jgi:hypothetical protein
MNKTLATLMIAVAGAVSLSAQAVPVDSDLARAQLAQQIQAFNAAVDVGKATLPRFPDEGQDPYYDDAKLQQHALQRQAHAAELAEPTQADALSATAKIGRDADSDTARMALHRAVEAQDQQAQRALQMSTVKSAAL